MSIFSMCQLLTVKHKNSWISICIANFNCAYKQRFVCLFTTVFFILGRLYQDWFWIVTASFRCCEFMIHLHKHWTIYIYINRLPLLFWYCEFIINEYNVWEISGHVYFLCECWCLCICVSHLSHSPENVENDVYAAVIYLI